MVTALVEAYDRASGPAHRAAIVKALTSVRDGGHNDYPAPPADLVAQLRRDASAALEKLNAQESPHQPGATP